MTRRIALPALLVAGALTLAACSSGSPAGTTTSLAGTGETAAETTEAAAPAADAVSIALVRQLGSGDYFEQWLAGAQAQADALGVDLSVANADGDDAQQALDLESAVNQAPDAIIVDHGFTETISPQVTAALDAGIPLVAFDVDTGDDRAIALSQSDHELATAVTDKLVEDTGGNAQVLYVYVAGFAPLDRRNEIWEDVKAANPGLVQVAQIGAVNDSTAATVADQAKAALQANPGVTAIFAPYDEFAKGAVLAVNELGLADTVKVYGADISTADIEVLTADGSPWVATAATDPANVGAVAVRAAYLAATGGDVPASIEVPPTLITADVLRDAGATTIADLGPLFPGLTTDDLVPVS